MNESIFDKLDFGPLRSLLDNDDITDISFDNGGQVWIRSLSQGSMRVEVEGLTPEFIEKLAFQCSNVMGTTFNNAKPFLDAESSELRLNFVHSSIATNGIAMVIRKTPAKIRLEKEKLLNEEYFTQDIHDILIKCVEGHCNIIVAGETGSGKTEFVKYLASHTKTEEKIITIEDTLELHLDRIFPQRDIVAMKTNNVASYTDVLVTCMRQNPKWILLSEVRSAEAVSAVRNSISSGHNILSTIHADKASAIPYRLYSLMETDLDVNQFLNTIYRYIQLGVHIRAYYSKKFQKFHREVDEVVEFYVDEDNKPQSRILYQKTFGKEPILRKPSKHLIEYLENQNIDILSVTDKMKDDVPFDSEVAEGSQVPQQPLVTEVQQQAIQPIQQEIATQPTEVAPPLIQMTTPQPAISEMPQPIIPVAPAATNIAEVQPEQPMNATLITPTEAVPTTPVVAEPTPVESQENIEVPVVNQTPPLILEDTQTQLIPTQAELTEQVVQPQVMSQTLITPTPIAEVGTDQLQTAQAIEVSGQPLDAIPSLSTQQVTEKPLVQITPVVSDATQG